MSLVVIPGVITNVMPKQAQNGRNYLFVQMDDYSGGGKYPENYGFFYWEDYDPEALKIGAVAVATGRIQKRKQNKDDKYASIGLAISTLEVLEVNAGVQDTSVVTSNNANYHRDDELTNFNLDEDKKDDLFKDGDSILWD